MAKKTVNLTVAFSFDTDRTYTDKNGRKMLDSKHTVTEVIDPLSYIDGFEIIFNRYGIVAKAVQAPRAPAQAPTAQAPDLQQMLLLMQQMMSGQAPQVPPVEAEAPTQAPQEAPTQAPTAQAPTVQTDNASGYANELIAKRSFKYGDSTQWAGFIHDSFRDSADMSTAFKAVNEALKAAEAKPLTTGEAKKLHSSFKR